VDTFHRGVRSTVNIGICFKIHVVISQKTTFLIALHSIKTEDVKHFTVQITVSALFFSTYVHVTFALQQHKYTSRVGYINVEL
jgi:hypothetical protein